MAHSGELLGLLVCARRRATPPFTEEEERVLSELARQVGLALHNSRLDSALQASLDDLRVANDELQRLAARIVAAADQSRRQIERNLHDGAQQHLVALAVKLGLARQLVEADPADGRDVARGAARRRAGRRSPSCASSRTASTRRCSWTAAWAKRCGPPPTAPCYRPR